MSSEQDTVARELLEAARVMVERSSVDGATSRKRLSLAGRQEHNVTNDHRGSRKHILDLVSSSDAAGALTALLRDVPVVVEGSQRMHPATHDEPGEWDIRAFCRECAPTGVNLQPLNDWWVSEDYKGPTWDLLAECSVGGRPGFLLVEAKAHESELHREGKVNAPTASAQSQANHQKIAESLAHTEQWFRANVDPSSSMSIDRHYQLANRLSAAERLASCGVPVVLLYLGFTGDTYFRTDYLRDAAHWQRVMGAYVEGTVPLWWPGTTTVHGAGSITMLIRSLPPRDVSIRTAITESGRPTRDGPHQDYRSRGADSRAPGLQAGMSDVALYEATRGVWKIGPRRDNVRFALAIYESVVQEVFEIG